MLFLSIFIFFFRLIKQHKISLWALLPLPFVLLSAYIYENSLWAMCSFENNDVCVFLCWSIFLIFSNNPNKTKFYLGLFLLGCALICNGNGILAFIVVGLGLAYQQRWQELIIVLATLLVLKFLFLSNSYYKTPNSISTTISSFSILVGGFLKTDSLNIIIKLMGFLIILFIAFSSLFYIIKLSKDVFELNIILIALFCLGSLFGVALFRDVTTSNFPDRYRLYPQLLLICVYLLLIKKFSYRSKGLMLFSAIFGLLYFLHSYYVSFPNIIQGHQKRLLSSVNLAHNGSTLNGSFYRLYFDQTINFYRKNKAYTFEKPIFNIKNAEVSTDKISFTSEETKQGFAFYFKNIDSKNIDKAHGYFISLENANHQFYFLPLYHTRNSLKKVLFGEDFLGNDAFGMVANAEIPADTYQVGLVSTIDSSPKYFKTDATISTHKVGYEQ
jgi:4-amino-4-deoxy-L-arabinose transferase-like glycosyltransferase